MEITDEELVYNIMSGNREAMELLYFYYEKKLRFITKKHEVLFVRLNYDYDDINELLWRSISNALNVYSFSLGYFFAFCSSILCVEINNLYRQKSVDSNCFKTDIYEGNEVVSSDNYLSDVCVDTENKIDFGLFLEKVKKIGKIEYQIVEYYLKGYNYSEISNIIHLSKQEVNYRITKVKKYFRKMSKENIFLN